MKLWQFLAFTALMFCTLVASFLCTVLLADSIVGPLEKLVGLMEKRAMRVRMDYGMGSSS